MRRPVYVGIDPGVQGGLVAIDGKEVHLDKMPGSDRDVLDWFLSVQRMGKVHACIEQVTTGFPGTGKSQLAKLYGSYRALLMALTVVGVTPWILNPRVWQRQIGLPARKGMPYKEWKHLVRDHAVKLFPKERVTLYVADALLLAERCRRYHEESR